MGLQRNINKKKTKKSPVVVVSGRSSTNNPDKGHMNGSCNRTACQRPLAEEHIHQFMDGNFTGGPKLYYCEDCAFEFDKWDRQSGDPVRIKRESK